MGSPGSDWPHDLLYSHDRGQTARQRRTRARLGGVFLIVLAYFGIKAALLAAGGQTDYERRLVLLADGTAFDRAAAAVLAPDPLSLGVSRALRGLMP